MWMPFLLCECRCTQHRSSRWGGCRILAADQNLLNATPIKVQAANHNHCKSAEPISARCLQQWHFIWHHLGTNQFRIIAMRSLQIYNCVASRTWPLLPLDGEMHGRHWVHHESFPLWDIYDNKVLCDGACSGDWNPKPKMVFTHPLNKSTYLLSEGRCHLLAMNFAIISSLLDHWHFCQFHILLQIKIKRTGVSMHLITRTLHARYCSLKF